MLKNSQNAFALEAPSSSSSNTSSLANTSLNQILIITGDKFNPKTPRCEDLFEFEEILGEGTYGDVVQAYHKETKKPIAIKIIDKLKIEQNKEILVREKQKWRLRNEIEIHKSLRHPNIVQFYQFFETPEDVCIVLELCSGRELFDRIVEKGRFSEIEASRIMGQIGHALNYLHSQGIVHRDVKPENILFEDSSGDSPVKITDFGLAKRVAPNSETGFATLRASTSGSTAYCAPERLNQQNENTAVDMWSVGCILYFMLMSVPPFYSHKKDEEENDDEVYDAILEGKITYPRSISPLAKDLIVRLLEKDPSKRITAEQMLKHPWINYTGNNSKLMDSLPSPAPKYTHEQHKHFKTTLNSMIDKNYDKFDQQLEKQLLNAEDDQTDFMD